MATVGVKGLSPSHPIPSHVVGSWL